jgi:hypothetical protein
MVRVEIRITACFELAVERVEAYAERAAKPARLQALDSIFHPSLLVRAAGSFYTGWGPSSPSNTEIHEYD